MSAGFPTEAAAQLACDEKRIEACRRLPTAEAAGAIRSDCGAS